jgi:hypothetical protein
VFSVSSFLCSQSSLCARPFRLHTFQSALFYVLPSCHICAYNLLVFRPVCTRFHARAEDSAFVCATWQRPVSSTMASLTARKQFLLENSALTLRLLRSYIYIQGVSKRALQVWKLIEIYTEDIHNVLNCQNVAKHNRVLPRIVIRNCFDLFFRFLLHGTSTVTVHRPGKRVLRYSRTSPR